MAVYLLAFLYILSISPLSFSRFLSYGFAMKFPNHTLLFISVFFSVVFLLPANPSTPPPLLLGNLYTSFEMCIAQGSPPPESLPTLPQSKGGR